MYKFGIMKTSWYDNSSDRDYEMYPQVIEGEKQLATALKMEEVMNELVGSFLRNHPSAIYDPVGIHHWGCDEVYVGHNGMNFLYKVVLINDSV